MPKIAISYRRKDSDAITGRIRDRIARHFGDDSVFMDIDNIPLGIDFRKRIQEVLHENQILLAIIGPNWTGPAQGARARIFDPTDPVRIEVETALQRGIPTIPVLVGGATMPSASELPESLKDLPFYNAGEVSSGVDFHPHVDRLIRAMEQILKGKSSSKLEAPRVPATAPASFTRRPGSPWAMLSGVALAVILTAAIAYVVATLPRQSAPIVVAATNASPPPTGQTESPAPAAVISASTPATPGTQQPPAVQAASLAPSGPVAQPQQTQPTAPSIAPTPSQPEALPVAPATVTPATTQRPPINAQTPQAAQSAPTDAERAWAVTKDTTSVGVLQAYIKQFGTTVYGNMARARLRELQEAVAEKAARGNQVAVIAPPAPLSLNSCGVVGSWTYHTPLGTYEVVFKSEGTAISTSGQTASWTCSGDSVTVSWPTGFTDHLSVRADGKGFSGHTSLGLSISGDRD